MELKPNHYSSVGPPARDIGRFYNIGSRSIRMNCFIKHDGGTRGMKCQCWVNLRDDHSRENARMQLEEWLAQGLDMSYDAHVAASDKIKEGLGMKLRKKKR